MRLLLALWTTSALAKEPLIDVTEVALGTGTGIVALPLGPLEDRFTAQGWAPFAPVMLETLAVNGELYANRHVPGFDHIEYRDTRSRDPNDAVRTDFSYTYDMLSYGYAAVAHKGWFVVPRVGIGLVTATATATPKAPETFGTLLEEPQRSLTMQANAFVLDIGTGLSYLVAFGGRDALGIRTGLRIGIRVGGLIELFHTSGGTRLWSTQGEPVAGAPDVFLGGPYLRVVISPSLLHRGVHVRTRKAK